MNRASIRICLFGVGFATSQSPAGATFFTSYSQWAPASAAYDKIDFNLGSLQFLGEQYAPLGVHLDGTSALAGWNPNSFVMDGWGIGSASDVASVVTVALDGPRKSFGVEYIGDAKFQLFSGTSLVFGSGNLFDFAALSGFGGVVLDRSFDSIKIGGANFSTLEADNLYIGRAIPAPGAACALALLMRRTRGRHAGFRGRGTSLTLSNLEPRFDHNLTPRRRVRRFSFFPSLT